MDHDLDPWEANGVIQRYCFDHNAIMGQLVRDHDGCERVDLLTHAQMMRLLFPTELDLFTSYLALGGCA